MPLSESHRWLVVNLSYPPGSILYRLLWLRPPAVPRDQRRYFSHQTHKNTMRFKHLKNCFSILIYSPAQKTHLLWVWSCLKYLWCAFIEPFWSGFIKCFCHTDMSLILYDHVWLSQTCAVKRCQILCFPVNILFSLKGSFLVLFFTFLKKLLILLLPNVF